VNLRSKPWRIALSSILAAVVFGVGGTSLFVSQTKVSPEAVLSSVSRTQDTIERAWNLPGAASFDRKVSWQSNVSLCGPASLANVFRSFGEPATTEQAILAETGFCWTGFCIPGLTLDELADLARKKTRRAVTLLRDLNAEEFREHLKRSNDPHRRYIINFTRKPIFGAGSGHHSPIGGYLESEDLVFVLDVNRDYQPWLVESARLFDAMNTWDGNKKRGMLLIQ
jgi:hypothetical protein